MAATNKAKENKPKKIGGPYLAAAVFCDSIVEGSDKALSAIRIVDRVTLTVPADAPPDVPSEKNRIPLTTNLLISFRAGYAKGKHELSLVVHSPSGKKQAGPKLDFVLPREPNGGANFRLNIGVMVKKGGLFWFDVRLDGKLFTRIPLEVIVVRALANPKAAVTETPSNRRKPRPSKRADTDSAKKKS